MSDTHSILATGHLHAQPAAKLQVSTDGRLTTNYIWYSTTANIDDICQINVLIVAFDNTNAELIYCKADRNASGQIIAPFKIFKAIHYNMTSIESHRCDRDNNTILLLATNSDGSSSRAIVVIIGKTVRSHQGVHSVVDVEGSPTMSTSWFDGSDIGGLLSIITMKPDTDSIAALCYAISQPVISINESRDEPGEYILHHLATLTRDDGFQIIHTRIQRLSVRPHIQLSVKSSSSIRPAAAANLIYDIEAMTAIDGPLVSMYATNPAVRLVDRLPVEI